jgi:hypothetical protein
VAEVVQPTYVEDNTYLEDRGSCCFDMALGCKSMLGSMVEYCKIPGGEKQVNHC